MGINRQRYEFAKLLETAHQAGVAAGRRIQDLGLTQGSYVWVAIHPATSAFGRWVRGTGRGGPSQEGGLRIYVKEFPQSDVRREAYAVAFSAVLQVAGIQAMPGTVPGSVLQVLGSPPLT